MKAASRMAFPGGVPTRFGKNPGSILDRTAAKEGGSKRQDHRLETGPGRSCSGASPWCGFSAAGCPGSAPGGRRRFLLPTRAARSGLTKRETSSDGIRSSKSANAPMSGVPRRCFWRTQAISSRIPEGSRGTVSASDSGKLWPAFRCPTSQVQQHGKLGQDRFPPAGPVPPDERPGQQHGGEPGNDGRRRTISIRPARGMRTGSRKGAAPRRSVTAGRWMNSSRSRVRVAAGRALESPGGTRKHDADKGTGGSIPFPGRITRFRNRSVPRAARPPGRTGKVRRWERDGLRLRIRLRHCSTGRSPG